MAENNYCIYIHKNKINNKVYVGQTCQNPEKRWRYGHGYKNCPRFFSAIKKYGWNNFEHFIIETGLTKEEADQKEIFYIQKYQSNDENFGYNLTEGGFSLGEYWKQEENRARQSENKKNYFVTHPEEKIKNDIHLKKISEESAEIRSEKMKENYQNQKGLYELNQQRKKAIKCVETQQVFDSLAEAAKEYNLSASNISSVLHKRRKTTGGFHWVYIDESMN